MKAHIENSKKFELDRLIIKQIYNIKEKKKFEYKVLKKNVIYDKQLTKQYFSYLDINRSNYFGNYQSFRDYLSTGYNSDFLVNEINNIKSILGYSQNLRQIVEKKINSNFNNNSQKKPFIEDSNALDLIINNNNKPKQKINNNIFPKQGSIRRPSTVFQLDIDNPHVKRLSNLSHKENKKTVNIPKKNNKFIEMCHLLKLKEEEMKNPQNQYHFRLYSKLSEEFDPFFLPPYENFMNVKYENQKMNLIKIYNIEKAFVNCVISIKEKLKSQINISLDKQNQENISDPFNNINIPIMALNIKQPGLDMGLQNLPQAKLQMKIPYVNAFYFGRTDAYFKEIDNFMSMYKENISLASKRLEKDFFENLYKILTFNNTNCKKFLHYLYSNSYFFKYIYNIFTTFKKSDDTLKNFAPLIKKHEEEEPFLNESQKEFFFSETKEKIEDENKLFIDKKKEEEEEKKNEEDDFFNSLIGNEFVYKIEFNPAEVSELVNKKKINKFKKILIDKENYQDNFIITLNNEKNMLEIYDLDKKEYIFSSNFDNNICFYNLEKDIKNNFNSEKIKKNIKKEKYILITQKRNLQTFKNSYIFKLSNDMFTRFEKSISSKGNKIKKTELFSSEEEKASNENEEKINLEDILSLRQEEEKNQSDSQIKDNDSEKPSTTKNEKNIKFSRKNFSRSMTFRKSSSGNEKSDNEEKEKVQKTESSMEIKEKEGKDEESEEDENEEESDKNDDKDEKNSDDDDVGYNKKFRMVKEKNPLNKISKKQKNEDKNSFDDNINNKLSEEKDDNNDKSDGSLTPKNEIKKIKNQKNLEEINTDMNNPMNDIHTIQSESKSSKDE